MAKYNNYKKYYETHTEQERKRYLDYYYANREKILAKRREKRKNMPKVKKPTLKERLAITEKAFKLACKQLYYSVENPKNKLYYFTEDEIETQLIREAEEEYKNGSMGD